MRYQVTSHLESLDVSGDRSDLESTFSSLVAANVTVTRVNIVGFTNQDKLLTLGTWIIDGASRKTRSLFRELAEQRILERLGTQQVRLFGCHTASTPRGRKTLAALSEILDLEVSGTTELVCAGSTAISSSERMLDLDALPAGPLDPYECVVTVDETHQILQLVNRTAGTRLPNLLALPHHRLALPSYLASAYHHLEMLLDFEYVRVAGDLVFPVEDPRALRALVERY